MTDMLASETLNYTLKRIVFVNSANHAYSEIRLDNHLALFGANNAGKTASLAATKLMLYPETDFSNCHKKFQFKGKTGVYSKEDSYEFYFPSPQSFLIMETKNDAGVACMVLYRDKGFRYYRIFLPLSYDEIRHLFWDDHSKNFANDLSVTTILAFQKKHGGLHVSDDRQLTELMYSNFTGAHSRYSIVPLSENTNKAVHAFRSIYQMAFDAGTGGTEALADAIATLIEMKRGRPQERMNADLVSLEEDYQKLLQKNEELQCLKNNKENYENLKSKFEDLKAKRKILTEQHIILSKTLSNSKASYASSFANLSKKLTEAQKSHSDLDSRFEKVEKETSKLEGATNELDKTIQKYQDNIYLAEQVLSQHDYTNAIELASILSERKEALGTQQSALLDTMRSTKKLEELTKSINQNTEKLKHKKDTLENIDNLMLTQLTAETADVLFSLNNNFGALALELTSDQIDSIKSFTNWFDTAGKQLLFNQVQMPNTTTQRFQVEEQRQSLVHSIANLEQRIKEDDSNRTTLLNATNDTSGASRQQSLDELTEEIATLSNQIVALERYKISLEDIEINKQQLKEKVDLKSELSEQLIMLGNEKDQAYQALQTMLTQRDKLESQRSNFDHYTGSLSQVTTSIGATHYSETEISEIIEAYTQRHDKSLHLDMRTINDLTQQANAHTSDYSELKNVIETFIQKVPNDNVDQFTNIQTLTQLSDIIATYNNSFSSLNYQIQTQANNISRHNQIISSQLREISDASQMLTDYVAAINAELNTHQISNLKQVRIKLHCHADFEHVRKLQKNHDITQTKLMSDEFYRTLMAFMEKHANKRTKLIKMRDIISKINFEYIDVNGVLTDKSQSGGTTSTITASIIAILLGQIFMQGASFKMPIVIDEIGDLDDDNTSTIIDCIDRHGFSAFCATPTQRASVCQSVKRWIRVDYNVFQHPPKVASCVLNILPESVEVWGQINDDQARLTGALA
ncbi:hypothetical protein ES754_00750 [Psychrobacter frigidicola]|uniref:Uncharacterized protein n=1 Tax=Psychrobacter frigidicola TaxID=45611 RepID=A0A5C7A396_9GAMM|nr:hypothetical protein [Psychrobacter frigidicola]TXD97548.1 hypothetical protein ES754_00750 [Psychrobacter frigidicola]